MERRTPKTQQPDAAQDAKKQSGDKQTKRPRKVSEYGKQLAEKQKVKEMYGLRERQFRNSLHKRLKSKRAGLVKTYLICLSVA